MFLDTPEASILLPKLEYTAGCGKSRISISLLCLVSSCLFCLLCTTMLSKWVFEPCICLLSLTLELLVVQGERPPGYPAKPNTDVVSSFFPLHQAERIALWSFNSRKPSI